ncbi:hypothetical protein M3P36_13740 [Altererythrobacter sp. KTW20L]|nr:hypothetical protein [Altererythrobacter sp. KTW20L]
MAQNGLDDRPRTVRDVALTPLTDLNLNQDDIPPLLVDARNDPYDNQGINGCAAILSRVADLDAILGDDYDTLAPSERQLSATSVASRVVGSFIPFRGIIRELSGANDRQRDFREAIAAGMMRRAYLKGRGESLGCDYPASPATPELIARLRAVDAENEARRDRGDDSDRRADSGPVVDENGFYSEPVVQQVN